MLSLDPATVGLHPSAELPRVWGALMEMGFPDGAATIVTLADGTTSLYTSEGGGVIGGGEHRRRWLPRLRRFLVEAEATETGPSPREVGKLRPPPAGIVSFVALGYSGTQIDAADEHELASRQHPLSPLYAGGTGRLIDGPPRSVRGEPVARAPGRTGSRCRGARSRLR